MRMQRTLFILPILVACVACGASGPSTSSPEESAVAQNGAGAPLYDRTIVHLNPNGSSTVRHDQLTAEQFQAEQAGFEARRAGAPRVLTPDITQDSNCYDGDITLWANATCNSGAYICFYGAGEANLNNWGYHTFGGQVNWADHVYSFWVGRENGYFIAPIEGTNYDQQFTASQGGQCLTTTHPTAIQDLVLTN
jgi:hypothetical protein